jgi:transcriptional regulator with XRE-family HTH domain
MHSLSRSAGSLVRELRRRARLTQLEFAAQAEISAKHLSFIETGRSQPSRAMLLRLSQSLQLPLRERNTLLNAAGFTSQFPDRPLADQSLAVVRRAIDVLLTAHEPLPAFAIDRHWTLVASNGGFRPFLGDVDLSLLQPPVNVLRLTLHPRGLGPMIANFEQWRGHVLDNLRRQILSSDDPVLIDLHRELKDYPNQSASKTSNDFAVEEWHALVVVTKAGVLSFYSTRTVFGAPLDVTLAEISLECFYPADTKTAQVLRSSRSASSP